MRLLIVEDEPSIANFVRDGFEEEGFAVDIAFNGKEGWQMAHDNLNEYDVILLDWMVPGMSGIEICRSIRLENKEIPVIFLTAKDTADDAVFALETGANDFIRKPFSFEELLARVRVNLRKSKMDGVKYRHRDIELDPELHRVTKNGHLIELTQKEFALLEFLLQNKEKVCRRTRIVEKVWDMHFDYDTSVIDVYINFLRKKLDDQGKTSFIQTVRGVGYRISELE